VRPEVMVIQKRFFLLSFFTALCWPRPRGLVVVLLLCFSSHPSFSYVQDVKKKSSEILPKEMEGIGITQNIGKRVNLDTLFVDETGQSVRLSKYITGDKPIVLSLVYYTCPSLCNFHLNGVAETLRDIKWRPAEDYEFVAISFDPKETPPLAQTKKKNFLKQYQKEGNDKGWHFLTGAEENIRRLADEVGFKYKWVDGKKEWAHASAAIMISPEGIITRYLPGVIFEKRDFELAISEASNGTVGNIIDQLVLFCFQFDPEKNKYSLYAFNVMRAGGGITVLLLILLIVPAWIRGRKSHK
jgi:protein SCO1/2